MNPLIEKVGGVVMATRYGATEIIAKEVIAAVLDHFSDPESVTDVMMKTAKLSWERYEDLSDVIAAVMRAAKEELE